MVYDFDFRTETKIKCKIGFQNFCNVFICYTWIHNIRNILYCDISKLETELHLQILLSGIFLLLLLQLIYHPLADKQTHLDYLNERRHLFREYTYLSVEFYDVGM